MRYIKGEVMINKILKLALAKKASDIHLTAGCVPVFRINGVLQRQDLPAADESCILSLGGIAAGTDFGERDFAYCVEGMCRLRVNIYRQSGKPAAAIRIINNEIPNLLSINAPQAIEDFTKLRSGLVLVTGATGSGKSTTLAAMIEEINRTRAVHIITLEDPVEYKFTECRSMIHQRELGTDTQSFGLGLRAALREDPDVFMVGELRDAEAIATAAAAAETGHLVLATLHTQGAALAVSRMVEAFAAAKQQQIRTQLADTLQGVVAQQLVPDVNGGRTAAFEVLTAIPAVRSLIREGRDYQLASYMQGGRQQGMQCMDFALAALVKNGKITKETAEVNAFDPALLNKYLLMA